MPEWYANPEIEADYDKIFDEINDDVCELI